MSEEVKLEVVFYILNQCENTSLILLYKACSKISLTASYGPVCLRCACFLKSTFKMMFDELFYKAVRLMLYVIFDRGENQISEYKAVLGVFQANQISMCLDPHLN